MRVVGYVRVSTDRQADEGLGLEVQEQSIRRWAREHGHRIVGIVRDEGISGSNGIESLRTRIVREIRFPNRYRSIRGLGSWSRQALMSVGLPPVYFARSCVKYVAPFGSYRTVLPCYQ
jgi:hypothetical protein